MEYSLIANSGIHVSTLELEIDTRDRYHLWFHEWYNKENGEWVLDILHDIKTETNHYLYKKKELLHNGYLKSIETFQETDISMISEDGIKPILIDNEMQAEGDVFKMTFADRTNTLSSFENKWLPLPYFFKRSEKKYRFGPLNWSRFKIVPISSGNDGIKRYKVLLAFDTRTEKTATKYDEYPVFPDQFATEMNFDVCKNEFLLMDFCSPSKEWEYVNNYLFKLVNSELSSVNDIKSGRKLNYIASYYLLINYIASKDLFPSVKMHKDYDVIVKDVDMVVDIGNSRTTALLVEDNSNFNQVNQLQLMNYTSLDCEANNEIVYYLEPFDMRLAFRKVNFGKFGIQGSKQFEHPSFVRLGMEANYLIHKATEVGENQEKLSTLSSPKRYLWDGRKSDEEWEFIVLEGEDHNHILYIAGLSEQLSSDGQVIGGHSGGQSYHYSRRSLMTFAFLEMLVQAQIQINSEKYRNDRGDVNTPRKVRRIIVTCPTAMSKIERDSLVKCAEDAVKLLNRFNQSPYEVDIIPAAPSFRDTESKWFYDEATCSQLVYIYGEIGYKYKGAGEEFFNLYGKNDSIKNQQELTIGSLDIGAGTSDLMISKYSYKKGDLTTITPDPLFYDSFYYAGDEMLHDLIKKVMFFSPNSAFRKQLKHKSETEYRQMLRDFFGPDYTGQTVADRQLRRDINLQYSVPLMYYFLELLSSNAKDRNVWYKDVFIDLPPNERVRSGFEKFFGFPLEDLEWEFNKKDIIDVVTKSFEPLLKKIATIMHSYRCDIVLLSGRPASLSPIRDIFLKYYSVSPNRLILLNNYYVGHWYPFSNNTGYIANPKTIVAMGALVSYYATSLGNLDRFVIDKSRLDENLKSVIDYIHSSRLSEEDKYLITPENSIGDLVVSSLPSSLNVRQLGISSYPSRELYIVDFNNHKISERIRMQSINSGEPLTDIQVLAKTKGIVDDLRLKMPFTITVERDVDDKELLTVALIKDRNGNEISANNIEINIQSLGAENRYWLDTGVFEIQ